MSYPLYCVLVFLVFLLWLLGLVIAALSGRMEFHVGVPMLMIGSIVAIFLLFAGLAFVTWLEDRRSR